MGSTEEIQPRNVDMAITSPTTAHINIRKTFPNLTLAEWDIVYYALALKGRGSPIHAPNPPMEQSIQYRKGGYSIGDVILFNIQGFVDFHFNTCVPADSPLNGHPDDIPPGYSPLFPPLDPANVREDAPFKGHTVLDGRSVRTFQLPGHSPGITFDAVAEEMAILTIPDGVISRDVIDVSCFRKYIAANAVGWYKFVNEVGDRFATNGDLRIVVGWDHCSSWSRVATSSVIVRIPDDTTTSTGSSACFNMGYTAGGRGVLHFMVDNEIVQDPEGIIYQNQTVFLRTLNISVCDDIWCKLAEDFRPHIDPYMRPLPDGATFNWKSRSIAMHPANGINALLLEQKPHAKFAITQDSDWISVLKPDDASLPSANELLSRILEVYHICEEDGVVFLEYKPAVLYRTYLKHDHDISRGNGEDTPAGDLS
ncbi:hypothetical protein M413DRAFT_447516 [Hebeloma cylindrosporum]|uniref:Uncharacterized protein n=1 Tax=Hebeloma cylindrosporum TaxID=76867 RepID=A0A0C3BQ77_HEBCY|nr:hypothetical protein M413DRAFT_447516 [Hebeloma cylindrosporum h7]